MASFTGEEILAATGGHLYAGAERKVFTGVSTDSRKIRPGELFVALEGENFDGHEFAARAVECGAAGVVVSRPVNVPHGAAMILVPDTGKALQDLASFHRRRFALPVVAVTGSNGKTTTKDMIAAVLGTKMAVLKTVANYNNEIGLPLTLLNLTAQHQAAVVELGMRGKGQIASLAAVALPNIAVVTNVGETHLGLLGSLANIAAAKRELVEALPPDGVAVLNADDERVAAMAAAAPGKVVFFGCDPSSQVRASDIRSTAASVSFQLITADKAMLLHVPVPGRHNVHNALAAAAVALVLGLSPADIATGLRAFTPSGMRLDIFTDGQYVVINDAYNASPLSMAAAIETLHDVSRGRKVAVLGDMLELGPAAAAAHRRVGDLLADQDVALVVTVGHDAAHIAAQARRRGVAAVYSVQEHAAAIEILRQQLRPGDTILVKGSRGMHMERVLEMFAARHR